jgi:hypothetical protein
VSTPTRPGNGAAVAPAGVTDDVPSYVAAVRARLDDLSPDEVEELTGGLEADLAEALAGFDETPRERFGDPAAYADELRAAADLPPRRGEQHAGHGPVLADLRDRLVALVDDQLVVARRHPWFAPVRDFLLVVRPAWWVLRAWVAVVVLRVWSGSGYNEYGLFGGFGWMVVLAFAIVASVTLGRRSPLRRTGARSALLVGNVLAVITLPFAAGTVSGGTTYVDSGSGTPAEGLWMNGAEVMNILPYDSQGRPLTGVQLYDDRGQPLLVADSYDWGGDNEGPRGPANVFPRPAADPEQLAQPDVPALEPTPAPTASVAPSATPSAKPSATASAAPPAPSGSAATSGVPPTPAPTVTPSP